MKDLYNDKIFPMLSLFSGGGFLDIGFMNQGFQIREAVEIEPYFIEAYNSALANYITTSENYYIKNGHVKHVNINGSVDASNPSEHKRLGNAHNGIWGLTGGPPCQDYSVGGSNAGIEGERGKLINSYFNIVKLVQPKFLFFENVEGLYKNKEHRQAFEKFVLQIEKLGYKVWHNILNVLDYGFPQDRPRIVLVAFKNEIIDTLQKAGYVVEKDNKKMILGEDNYAFNWPTKKFINPKSIDWPTKTPFNSRIREASLKIPDEYASLQVINAFEGLKKSTPNQKECFVPKSKKFGIIEEGDTNRKSFKRLHRYRYSPTVAYGNNEVHLHPTEARRLTVREALRLQTAPDNYILPSTVPLTHKFKLISNAVPVAKAELVAAQIRRTLINYLKVCEDGHLVERKKK